MTLDTPVSQLWRVGKVVSKIIRSLGIETCRDLIFYFPYRFDDFSRLVPIAELKPSMTATARGTIQLIENRRSKNRKVLTTALIADGDHTVKAIWFNQPFLVKNLKVGDRVSLSGKTNDNYYDLSFVSPAYEKIGSDSVHTGRLVPVYSLTSRITQKQFRTLQKIALDSCLSQLTEWLPFEVLKKENLFSFQESVRAIHFPQSDQEYERARARLAFDELFLIQLSALAAKKQMSACLSFSIPFDEKATKRFVSRLPFSLTETQKKASWEIVQDLTRDTPMNRLLEGDVGSGKTVVCALAFVNVACSGFQSVYMAPTELLARQSFEKIKSYFGESQPSLALLTSSQAEYWNGGESRVTTKADVKNEIKQGKVHIIIGTHALLEKDVVFQKLALAVVDEQHRFGVLQRQLLRGKNPSGELPHLLSMTATPIPRSLALAMYGDLDLSLLVSSPKGRRKIITKVVPSKFRSWTYDFVRKQAQAGLQTLVICPLIDPSDQLGVASAKDEFKKLSTEIFPDLRVSMLHGKMKPKEKSATMAKMAECKSDILVSTSVVEVGIDLPKATVILIEGAERFGLAQLHQLRGRVGRSVHQSYCFLLPSSKEKEETERLKSLVRSHDGFALAEEDLRLRGEGDVYGRRQSGIPELKLAHLGDLSLMKKARDWAETYIDRLEEFPLLKGRLEERERDVHLE